MQDKISIIIPVFNVEKYIGQCLDSVIDQTYQNLEIICVEDGSPDNSLNIVKEYAQKDDRIKILKIEERLGVGGCRNEALKIATGKYVMFVDSDDWIELNACEEAYNCIEKNQSDITVFNYYRNKPTIGKKDMEPDKLTALEIATDENGKVDFSRVTLPYLYSAEVWYKIYRLDFLNKNDVKFGGKHFEDMIFTTKSLMLTKNVSVLNKPLYNYRMDNTDSDTKNASLFKYNIEGRISTFNYVLENCKDKQFLNAFLVRNYLTCLFWFGKYEKAISSSEKQEVYSQLRDMFKRTAKCGDINYIKNHIDYSKFLVIISFKSYLIYHLYDKFFSRIFSISNEIYKTRYTFLFVSWARKKNITKNNSN